MRSPSSGVAAPAPLAAAASSSPQSRCSRTMADWLAVASKVPSSAQRCTRPCPKPFSTAWTHVGQDPFRRLSRHDPQRVVEAVAAGVRTERLPDTEGHEVAHDRECSRRHVERREVDPERRPSVSGWTGEVVHGATGGKPGLGRSMIVPLVSRQPVGAGCHPAAARRDGSPTIPTAGSLVRRALPFTVKISSPSTRATAAPGRSGGPARSR